MICRPSLQSVAVGGAVAISASLIGFAALPQASGPQTHTQAVQLTAGDAESLLPDLSSFASSVAATAAALPADAYSYADLLASIQNTTGAGDGYLTAAETAFAGGDSPHALADALAGFNDLTVGVQSDLLTNGYALLTGVGGNAGYVLSALKLPADLASAFTEAQNFAANAQDSLSTALTELASGDQAYGVANLAEASIDSTYGTDAIILGLFDSLTGVAVVP